jgi:hypothetical protein
MAQGQLSYWRRFWTQSFSFAYVPLCCSTEAVRERSKARNTLQEEALAVQYVKEEERL